MANHIHTLTASTSGVSKFEQLMGAADKKKLYIKCSLTFHGHHLPTLCQIAAAGLQKDAEIQQ